MKRLLAFALVVCVSGCLQPAADNAGYRDSADPVEPLGGPYENWATLQGNNLGQGNHPGDFPYCKASVPTAYEECVDRDWRIKNINKGPHGAAKSSAVLYNGTIYVGADTGALFAITPEGDIGWKSHVDESKNGIHGTPTVNHKHVYIGGYDGAVYAFDRLTGERVWKNQVGSWIGSSPRLHDGHIFISVEHGGSTAVDGVAYTRAWGDVQILNATTGETVWRSQQLGSHPHSSVAISVEDNVFVVGCNDAYAYAWNLDTLDLRWKFRTNGDIKGPMMIYNGTTYFGSWDYHYYAVDLATGYERWRINAIDMVMTGSAVDPDSNTVYFGGHAADVIAADATTGEIRWKTRIGAHLIGAPTLVNGMLLFGASDYNLHAFDAETGDELWRYPTLHRVSAAPLIVGNRIVFADRSECGPLVDGECEWGGTHGMLYALGPAQS